METRSFSRALPGSAYGRDVNGQTKEFRREGQLQLPLPPWQNSFVEMRDTEACDRGKR